MNVQPLRHERAASLLENDTLSDSILESLGWNAHFESSYKDVSSDGDRPARVVEEHRELYRVICADGNLSARLAGALRHTSSDRESLPAVGDWVAVTTRPTEGTATVQAVLPRRTVVVRKVPQNRTANQVIAANVDFVFLVTSCQRDFNLRRLERTLAILWESGAQPVVVLNKCDLVDSHEELTEEAAASAPGVPVHSISAATGQGLEALEPYLRPGRTVGLVGSSGVGKSTLINRLEGRTLMQVGEVRSSDSRGRHTTSHRQLFRLRGGALVIDTPGMREVALWAAEDGMSETFSDIESLAASCRFKDCEHATEPGCAVQAAVTDGSLAAERLANYEKLQRELAYLERRKDSWAQREQKRHWRRITRAHRKRPRP